jgi:hypothetical protein
MQGATIRQHETYYRCIARTLAPGAPALADHPRTVNLREFDLVEPLNEWIGHLFEPRNVDRTVAALIGSQQDAGAASGNREAAKKRLADAEARLRRFQAAIAAGIDPAAVMEAVNESQAQRAAARAELEGTPAPNSLTEGEVYAMIDSLGDVGEALTGKHPESLTRLYQKLGLELRYMPTERAVDVLASPRVVSVCVRGRSCTLFTRLQFGGVA